jgi:hypothetical protein
VDLEMIPYDNPEKASVGYAVISSDPKAPPSAFEIAFAMTPDIEEVTREFPEFSEEDPFAFDKVLANFLEVDKVLTDFQEGLYVVRVDDPKRLRIGFGVYGVRFSSIRYFKIQDIKSSPPELQERLTEWHEAHPNGEYRKLAAKMLGEEEI